jgi:type I restriction enzyme S subunit
VEWLEDIPSHWEQLALARVLAQPITDGPHTTPEFIDEGVPFLSVDGIQNNQLVFDGCRSISTEDHKEFSRKALPKRDDILMGKAASVGKIARVKVDFEFSIWSPLALIRPNRYQCFPAFLERGWAVSSSCPYML